MNPRSCLLALALLLTANIPETSAAEPPRFLRAGAAQVRINPSDGTPMAGYYHTRGSEGVADDRFSKALVLDDGTNRVALVTLDLISTTRSLVEKARAEIARRTGIPGTHVMISATHAHTGPVLADGSSRYDALGGADPKAVDYSATLPALIAESVERALAVRSNVVLSAATARCDDLAFNRRFFMRDGSVAWHPGKRNADLVLPAGVTDPELSVLLVEPPHDPARLVAARAVYVNFALHPDTVGGNRVSADYPGALARRMADYHGAAAVTLFANGACGNLNHIDTSWGRDQKGAQEANRIATLLAAAVFRAEKDLRRVAFAPLRARSEIVKLPLPTFTQAKVEQARLDARTARDNTRDGFMKLVNSFKILDVAAREGRPLEVEVQVFALGDDLAWVSLPGEVFVELGLAIKQRSGFRQTMIAELANGSIGYIPDRRAYAEGNYEPVSARCAAGGGELVVDAAVRLLKALAAEARNETPPR